MDGPAGAGKSTLARALARALGCRYIDTGATYRAAALAALEAGIEPSDPSRRAEVIRLVTRLDLRLDVDPLEGARAGVFLGGRDVTAAIRTRSVGRAASDIATIPEVRRILGAWQRKLAEEGPCVVDGRDIGTVVLPEACVKLFVTASLEERARRRLLELETLEGTGAIASALRQVTEEIRARDLQDIGRRDAPLRPAFDAITLDTTGLTLEAAVSKALAICRRQLEGGD